jgi:hypothetical protein
MSPAALDQSIQTAPVPARARQGFQQLAAATDLALEQMTPEHARIVAALFSGLAGDGGAAGQAFPDWVSDGPSRLGNLTYPRQEQGLRREVKKLARPGTGETRVPKAPWIKLPQFNAAR